MPTSSELPKTTTVQNTCPFCGTVAVVENVPILAILQWQGGELIQNAFPDFTPQQRETIKTGICASCWDAI